jgi:hypothetical protein
MSNEFPRLSQNEINQLYGLTSERENTTPRHFVDSYTLVQISVTLKNGTVVYLNDVFELMEVFEDMFSPSLSGFLRIRDYVGGLEKFIFTGGEVLTIRATKPNQSNEIIISRDDLVIYEISKVKVENQNTMTYELHFTSRCSVESQKKRLYQSYGGNRLLTDVVKKVYSEIERSNFIDVASTQTTLNNSFVCPGYTPFEALNHLTKRACVDGDYYVFFEKFNGKNASDFKHVFMGLNTIKRWWESSGGIPKILYTPGVVYVTESGAETNIVSSGFQLQNNFKHLDYMMGGFYNSRVRQINPLSRKYQDTKISYQERSLTSDFYTNRFLETNNLFSQYNDSYPEFPGERLVVSPMNDSIINKRQWVANDTYGAILNSSLRVLADIPGGSNKVRVGYVVEMSIPSMIAKSLNLESSLVKQDEMHSGKYLVTACRHILDKQRYRKKLELSRGSLKFNINRILQG